MKTTILGIIGERPPFLSMTKASKLRVFDAMLKYDVNLLGSFIMDKEDPKSSVIYSIEIEESKLAEFERESKSKLCFHPDISIGRDVMKSQKKIIYDIEETK